jgi:hypothetical protein
LMGLVDPLAREVHQPQPDDPVKNVELSEFRLQKLFDCLRRRRDIGICSRRRIGETALPAATTSCRLALGGRPAITEEHAMSSLVENETREFRSPQRKLVRFFERSRNKWKGDGELRATPTLFYKFAAACPWAGHTVAWGVVRRQADETPGIDAQPPGRSSPMVSIQGRLAETAIVPPRCLVRTAVWLPFREHVGDGALLSWGCAALQPRLRHSPPPAGIGNGKNCPGCY